MVTSAYNGTACCVGNDSIVTNIYLSLLGVGPNAEGVIVEPMVGTLLVVGEWLRYSGSCIYETVSGIKR